MLSTLRTMNPAAALSRSLATASVPFSLRKSRTLSALTPITAFTRHSYPTPHRGMSTVPESAENTEALTSAKELSNPPAEPLPVDLLPPPIGAAERPPLSPDVFLTKEQQDTFLRPLANRGWFVNKSFGGIAKIFALTNITLKTELVNEVMTFAQEHRNQPKLSLDGASIKISQSRFYRPQFTSFLTLDDVRLAYRLEAIYESSFKEGAYKPTQRTFPSRTDSPGNNPRKPETGQEDSSDSA